MIFLLLSELQAVAQVKSSGSLPEQRKALREAIKAENAEEVRTLLASGADANARYYGRIPLHDAVYNGNRVIIRLLLENGADVNRQNDDKRTALHMHVAFADVARQNKTDVDIVRLLLAHGARAETKDKWGNSPIDSAMSRHRPDIVKALLGGVKNLTIHQAAYIGQWKRIEFQLDEGADINERDEKGRTPLYQAACAGNQLGIVERLIASGADISLGSKTWTPLYGAVYYSHFDIAKVLIDNGADVNVQRHEGMTPLHVAIDFSYSSDPKDIIEYLLAHGARIDIRDDSGATPVDTAITRNLRIHDRSDVVALLLSKIQNKTIHQAAYVGKWERIKLLLSSGTDIDERDRAGCTALYHAAWGNQLQIARRLIAEGADVNATNKDGLALLHDLTIGEVVEDIRPIHYTQPEEYREIVELLLVNGADVNIRGGYREWTALQGAARNGDGAMVNLLIAHGADVNARDRYGRTPIFCAIADHHDIAVLLMQKGASATIKAKDGSTSLHVLLSQYRVSLRKTDTDLAELLISKGADINARDKTGRTPLHCAAESGYQDIVRMLLNQGAKVNSKDERGLTPLDWAAQRDAVETYRILEAFGAQGQIRLKSNQ